MFVSVLEEECAKGSAKGAYAVNTTLTYKAYSATIEYDEGSSLYCGSIADMRDGVYFETESLEDVERAFHGAVDDYLAFCEAKDKIPER